MNLLINASITVNIALILLFTAVCIINSKENAEPKLKAGLGTSLGAVLFLYLIFLLVLSVTGFVKHNVIMSGMLVFAVIPFVIGHFMSYKTLKIFSLVQLIAFILNLYFLLVI